ncbi:ABC transporter permease subunit [Sphaerisporangium sp. B11E5]|uniref:ABC transporter permease subunit n=1 Tax=Sphaerisporangium sp. B11E5 TaxID=3153563 RepID=UPI00325EAA23
MRDEPLLFAVTPRMDPRAPATWSSHGRWAGWGYLLPAVAVMTAVLVAPLAMTVIESLRFPDAYRTLVTAADFWLPLRNNLIWMGFALVACALGLGLALLARDVGGRLRRVLTAALTVPAVVTPLAAGITLRLIFDFRPERGLTGGGAREGYLLGPGWIWLLLGMAFVWQWTGVAFLVFREGLGRIRGDLLRVARVFAPGRWSRARLVLIPALFPTAAVAGLIVLIAATRAFEIVLVAVPGSIQDQVDVLGLYWWRQSDVFAPGEREALGVLLFLIPATAALLLLWRLRRDLPPPGETGGTGRTGETGARGPGRVARAASALVAAVWLTPIAVLLLTSLRDPVGAARSGVRAAGHGFASYAEALRDGSFLDALTPTATRSLLVAVLVVLLAVPAAYGLTYAGMRRRAGALVVALAAALATIPPQAVAVPLGRVTDRLVGGPVTLSLVHTALVLPLAVLLLRNAFLSVPRPVVDRPLAQGHSAFRWVVEARLPAVVTVAVLAAVFTWNDLIVSLLLNWPAADQVPLVIWQQAREFATSAGPLAAESVMAGAVPVVLVLATGRWLTQGLTQGVAR